MKVRYSRRKQNYILKGTVIFVFRQIIIDVKRILTNHRRRHQLQGLSEDWFVPVSDSQILKRIVPALLQTPEAVCSIGLRFYSCLGLRQSAVCGSA